MEAFKVVVFLTLLGICNAEAQPCEHCEAEESSLLQAKLQAEEERFPDFGALKDVVGGVADAAADIKDQASGVVTKVFNTATSTVEATLKTVDSEVDVLAKQCNESFDKFKAAADINASLGDNITKFQELLNSTVGKAIPLYENINEKVDSVLSTVAGLLKQIGQGDLAETMNTSMTAAMAKMSSLRDSAQTALTDAGEVATSEAVEKLGKVNSALTAGAQTASEFADSLQSSLKESVDGLKKVIAEKLPADQQESVGKPLDSLLAMATALCEKLRQAVANLAGEVEESSKTVTESAEAVAAGNKGFWGHIKDFFSSLR